MKDKIKLIKHPRWRWVPGMRVNIEEPGYWVVFQTEVTEVTGAVETYIYLRNLENGAEEVFGPLDLCVPDLTDPATVGCLWSMLRKDEPGAILMAQTVPSGHPARVNQPDDDVVVDVSRPGAPPLWGEGATLGTALADALLRVWEEGR